jgi:deoxyribonuclease-4
MRNGLKLGAHVRTAGGVDKAIDRGLAMGAECIQIFSGAPQAWRRKVYTAAEVDAYRRKVASTSIQPCFIHGLYLVNLATDSPALLSKSYDALVADMQAAHLLGAAGVVFHIGSHKGAGLEQRLSQVVEYCARILAATPDDVWLILENSAGMGGSIGSKLSELGRIAASIGDTRARICFDTQHAFAAGYDVKTRIGLDRTLEELDQHAGLHRLVLVHANDSKCPLGAGVDRHENIGQGFIGLNGFENILGHPTLQSVSFVLEVPGLANEGPAKPNLDILKALRAKKGAKEPLR